MSLRVEHKDGRKVEIGVISIPNRKRKALVIFRGANIDVLAYFTCDENADRFEEAIDAIVDICK